MNLSWKILPSFFLHVQDLKHLRTGLVSVKQRMGQRVACSVTHTECYQVQIECKLSAFLCGEVVKEWRPPLVCLKGDVTSCPVATSRCMLIHFNMQLIAVAAVCVCGTASTVGANRKQGLCGRCLCSKLLCFPSSRSSKGLFSLLSHSDDTANQRVSCFVSLPQKTKKKFLPQHVA